MSKEYYSLSDEVAKETIIAMLIGIPILVGCFIILFPFIIISCITDVPTDILVKTFLIFCVAFFMVWLFSKHQIIENSAMGIIAGAVIYSNLKWHPLICILIGAIVVGGLFALKYLKVGFWIKTILFSFLITLIVFTIFYSEVGLFPVTDNVWKSAFLVVFFVENLYIRYMGRIE